MHFYFKLMLACHGMHLDSLLSTIAYPIGATKHEIQKKILLQDWNYTLFGVIYIVIFLVKEYIIDVYERMRFLLFCKRYTISLVVVIFLGS